MGDITFNTLISILGCLSFFGVSQVGFLEKIDEKLPAQTLIIGKCPSHIGHLLQTVLFFIMLLTALILLNICRSEESKETNKNLASKSLFATLLFFFISNGSVYWLTNKLFKGVTDGGGAGCPTDNGIILHSVVYGLLLFGMLYIL